jgi:hypothetical protein
MSWSDYDYPNGKLHALERVLRREWQLIGWSHDGFFFEKCGFSCTICDDSMEVSRDLWERQQIERDIGSLADVEEHTITLEEFYQLVSETQARLVPGG